MKVLILSCSTGGGHNSAAKAIKQAFELLGHTAVLEDTMALVSDGTSKAVGGLYVETVKCAPRVFGGVYKAGQFISGRKHRSPVYFANALLANRLEEYLSLGNFDAVVSSHLYPSETLTFLKRRGVKLPFTVSVATDYTCIPFFEETYSDRYIIAHPTLKESYINRGVVESKILPYGIPVSQEFFKKRDKSEISKELGLLPDVPVHLVVGGSMGFGKLSLFIDEFLKSQYKNEQLVAICGSNEKARRELSIEYLSKNNVKITGFTDRIHDYMDACDVIYTKPGGLTSTEALAKNIPIVHTAPIPGCETENVKFFTSNGLSLHASSAAQQIVLGGILIHYTAQRDKMLAAQKKFGLKNSGILIAKLCEKYSDTI